MWGKYMENKKWKKSELILFLIGLSNDPDNEISGFLPRTRKQFKWNHVQHSNCLVYLCVDTWEINQPDYDKS